MNAAPEIPQMLDQEIGDYLSRAANSDRRRYPKLLHNRGDEFNRVFNFMMHDSYMQPHLHPSPEKTEKIHIVQGKVAVLYFDDQGIVTDCTLLEKDRVQLIEVPAFAWHTYVVLTDNATTYETMTGVYEPQTWKRMANWAPQEASNDCPAYVAKLRRTITTWIS